MAKRPGPPGRGPHDEDGEEPEGAAGGGGAEGVDDLTESTAYVFLSESDARRLDSSEAGQPAPAPEPAPAAPAGAAKKPPAGSKPAPPVGPSPKSVPPARTPRPPAGPPTGEPPPSRLPAVALVLLLLLLSSAAAGYGVHRWREADVERARAEGDEALDRARGEARAEREEQARAFEGRLAAGEEALKRARGELEAARRGTEEVQRAVEAERKKAADDFRAMEQTLKESLEAQRDAEMKQVEKRERERAARERLDLERSVRETIERFQALLDEGENLRRAQEEVLKREARAEILRREAVLRKQFEEERASLEAEKAKEIELETAKIEERLREELAEEGGGSGFIRGGKGAEAEEGGVDLEAEVWEHLKGHLSGSAEYRLFAGFEESPQPLAERARSEGIFRLRYDLKPVEGFELQLTPRVRADSGELSEGAAILERDAEKRPIFTFEEGWALGRSEHVDLKLGKLIVGWGTGDLLNPTDVLNPVDFTDLIDSEKIGVGAADVSAYIGDATRIRLVGIPVYAPARLPPEGERFSLIPPGGIFLPGPTGPVGPVPVADRELPARTAANAMGAVHASTTLERFDLSATYYGGFQSLPTLLLEPAPAGAPVPLQLTPVFDRIHLFGLDFSTTLGDLELHGEAAQTLTEGDRDDDYLRYVVGGNYSRSDLLLSRDDLRLILEYSGEAVTRQKNDPLAASGSAFARAFSSAFLARLTYSPIRHLELQATGALIVDGAENAFFQPSASYELGSHTKLRMGLDIFGGPSGTFFGQYDGEDRFWLTFKLSF